MSVSTITAGQTRAAVNEFWQQGIRPKFLDYVAIPCINLAYAPKTPPCTPPEGAAPVPPGSKDCYYPPGYKSFPEALCAAASLARGWLSDQAAQHGLNAAFVELQIKTSSAPQTPMLLCSIAGSSPTAGNVLFWGHLDKQSTAGEENQWNQPPGQDKYGPFCPVLTADGKSLYGRGTSDDGFAMFFAFAALAALKKLGADYPAFHMVVDFDEENGSKNLKPFLEATDPQSGKKVCDIIGTPDLIVTLDSGAGDYQRLWYSTSERGTITGPLKVAMLSNPVHSGDGGGVIPNPTRIIRQLLSRIEDPETGRVLPAELNPAIPQEQMDLIEQQAQQLGPSVYKDFPFLPGAHPATTDPTALLTDKLWRAALAVTGSDLPNPKEANNVIVAEVTFELSMRVPPSVDVNAAQKLVRDLVTKDPPYGATVTYHYEDSPIGQGWFYSPGSLKSLFDQVSTAVYGKPAMPVGDGGTVPVLAVFKELWPHARFLATGAAGPGNNEHAANENLNVPYTIDLATCVAMVLNQLGSHLAD